MRVDGDECSRSDAGVDGIPYETFVEASEYDIVRNGGESQGCEVRGNGRRYG